MFSLVAYSQVDASRLAVLDNQLLTYFKALENRSVDQKIQEVDFMIGSCEEGEVRNHVALKIYDYYMKSKLMGDEAVAIHVTDAWFDTGKASMKNDIDLMNARIYSEFNKRSLIGMHAPSLRMKTPDGETKEVLGVVSDSLANGSSRYRVLFMYDSDCPKCRMESIMLKSMFRQIDYPIDFIAIYTGDNAERWAEFRKTNLEFELKEARIFHYWDPEYDSDYQRKYGVLQTPRLFLIGKDGVILGRSLDTAALMKLLDEYAAEKKLNYGEESSMEMFSLMMPESNKEFTADSVIDLAKYISESTLVRVKDTTSYRQLTGDMLYYLAGKKGETFVYGSAYVADSMVLARPDIWKTQDDSLKVVGLAQMISDMVSRTPLGSRLPKIKVLGTMRTQSGSKTKQWKLSALKMGTSVVFHTEGCEDCRRELDAVDAYVSANKRKVLLINIDDIVESYPETAELLFDTFDLTSFPFVMEVGNGSTISRKYSTLVEN